MNIDYPEGATPLTPEEEEGLLVTHITTRAELDFWEQKNILEAQRWAFRGKKSDILTTQFINDLHKRMFGSVWRWAGAYRTTGKNIGVLANEVHMEMLSMLDDISYWVENAIYTADEIAARFHHRLTVIHPFPNGNGRHARLMCDIVLVHLLSRKLFTWGRGNLIDAGDCRGRYIDALRAADQRNYGPLLGFVRS